MKVTLYTYQSKEAVEILKKNGVLRLKEEDKKFTHAGHVDGVGTNYFETPYKFMIHKMKEVLPSPHEPCFYPIWAWYKLGGRYKPSKHWDKIHHGNIRLKIEIDSSRFLLSDFDMFCYIIGGGLYFKITEEDVNKYENHIFDPDEFFYPNWEYIFDINNKENNDYNFSYRRRTIQATFWELYLEDVVEFKEV